MFIQSFALKKWENTKIFTHHKIIDSIPEKSVPIITNCAQNQNYRIIRTYGNRISDLFIHLRPTYTDAHIVNIRASNKKRCYNKKETL